MVKVSVPATSANIGSGFDSCGLALSLYNTAAFEEFDGVDITSSDGTFVPSTPGNLIYRTAKEVYALCGRPFHGLRIEGDTHTCPQTISFSVCCKWFRWSVLPQIGTLEAEIFRDKELKRCAVCGRVFVPKSNRAKYCPDCAARVHRRQKTESERKRRSCVDS